jgi:hypothetical protein
MKARLLVVMIAASTSVQAEEFAVDIPTLQAEAKQVITQLASTLMGELKKAKQEGGAPAAIAVCNTKAMPLTHEVSASSGWEIGRTSLKLRNPDNAPDAWEKQVLEQFAKQTQQGANLKTLGFSQVIVDESGRKVFRMMKAIPVGDQCLACHGTNIKPALHDSLQALYPEDQATGYSAGDLRGAFTLKKYL